MIIIITHIVIQKEKGDSFSYSYNIFCTHFSGNSTILQKLMLWKLMVSKHLQPKEQQLSSVDQLVYLPKHQEIILDNCALLSFMSVEIFLAKAFLTLAVFLVIRNNEAIHYLQMFSQLFLMLFQSCFLLQIFNLPYLIRLLHLLKDFWSCFFDLF